MIGLAIFPKQAYVTIARRKDDRSVQITAERRHEYVGD